MAIMNRTLFWRFTAYLWICLFMVVEVVSFPDFELHELTQRVEKGKEEINKLQLRASLPAGSCWKSALEDLQVNCKGMVPENQSRLALRFTSCYNELFGFPMIICERSTPIATCMQKLDSDTQSTFREFFLHTQDMCYFIEHQLWQERTSNAVNDVTNAVFDVTKNLEEAKETQDKVLQSQQESLKVQSNIIKDNSEIYTMVLNVKDVFEDVQASAVEQRQVVVEVFEKLSRMQKLVSWIQGEMSLLDMMGFYFACILFGFFGTSSKRTQSARFWVVAVLIMTLAIERYLYNYLNTLDNYAPETIQEYVWNVRRSAAILGVLLIICTAAYYRDPQVVQHNMLTNVNCRLEKMSGQLENMQKIMRTSSLMSIDQSLDYSSSDDTFSNYSDDDSDISDTETSESKLAIAGNESADESNDENRIPETEPKVTTSIYQKLTQHFVAKDAPTVNGSTGTTNSLHHSYNLRTRNTSLSPVPLRDETPTEFAKFVKTTYRRRSSMYYSSDEDV